MDKTKVMAALAKSDLGVTGAAQASYAVTGAPTVMAMINRLDENPRIPDAKKEEIIVALGNRYNKDSTVIGKLEKDMKSDPNLASRIERSISTNPDGFIKNTLPAYTGGNMDKVLPAVAAAAPTAAPSASKPAAATPQAPAATKQAAVHHTRPAPAAVAAEPAATTPAQAAPSHAQTAAERKEFAKAYMGMFATANDADISSRIDSGFVAGLADGLADKAIENGVNPSTAEGFKKAINDPKNPALRNAITQNLKNNPDFVRQLAINSKDGKMPEGRMMKDMALSTMTGVMANPQDLADDKFVKGLTQKLKMANSGSSLSASLGGVFELLQGLGPFGQRIAEGFKSMMSGLTGDKSVFSMVSSGRSMFPTVMINLKNYRENENNAEAFSRYNPQDMKALPVLKDGKPTHTVVDTAPDGKEIRREVANTVDITDSKGKKHQVIPSVGALEAKQEKGSYGPNGEWKPGNVRVPVVTDITPNGNSSKIDLVSMTPADFDRYKKEVEKQSGRMYPFSAYTQQDAELAGIRPNVRQGGYMVANVDRNSGQVSDPAVAYPAAPTGAVTSPVRAPQVDTRELPKAAASNDPEYNQRANAPV